MASLTAAVPRAAMAQLAALNAQSVATYSAFAEQLLRQPPADLTFLPGAEGRILAALNAARAAQGQAPVMGSAQLQAIARVHAADMIARGYFDHVNPDGLDPASRVALLDRSFVGLSGENIGQITGAIRGGVAELAERFHANWMRSPGHRENILRSDWTVVGVGVAAIQNDFMAVQVFGRETARVAQPVPMRVPRGAQLDLRTAGAGPNAQFVDLWDPNRTAILGRAPSSGSGPITVPTGTYQLRFYFRRGTGFDIFDGPLIVVE